MTPLRIGACMKLAEIETHRDWLFESDRDLELQDLVFADTLADPSGFVAAARTALDGYRGRLGVHGPFWGLDIHTPDADMQRVITARFLAALDAAADIGARQMVLHRHVYVNGRTVNIPSYTVDTDDEIIFDESVKDNAVVKSIMEKNKEIQRPAFLEFDAEAVRGKMLRMPTREEISIPVQEQLIVELYSK